MKNLLYIAMVLCGVISNANAQQTRILPDGSTPPDTLLTRESRKTVDKIDSIELRCDTMMLYRQNGGDFFHFKGVYFDEQQRLRKYVSEYGLNDGAHECGKLTAYYSESGNAVYISYDRSNNCESSSEYFYLDKGIIVDFCCFEYCGCCDEEYNREEFRPWIGIPLPEAREYLADYVHTARLLDRGFDNKYKTHPAIGFLPVTFPKTEVVDVTYVDDLTSVMGIVRDSIENPRAYFISSANDTECLAIYADGRYALFDILPDRPFNSYYIERMDIDGCGNEELVIRWKKEEGRSGINDGFSIRQAGILVWDLDSFTCVLDLLHLHEFIFHWESSSGEGGSSEWLNHDVKLRDGNLIIGRGVHYILGESTRPETRPSFIYTYKYTDRGFVLDAIHSAE